ncbi:MAG: serine/threonine-protein kinase, partial [Wenzhouxiangellaceae bacterium]
MDEEPTNIRQPQTRTITSTRRMLPAGTLLAGRYRILEVLGAGGMGTVYSAHDETLNLDIALKVLSDRLADEPAALERFRQEIRLARQVSHPNVVRIHDIGADGDLLFMTMDQVPGQTLVNRLADGPLAPPVAVGIAIQLAKALGEAHRHDIIHRDVKPSNVLVDGDDRAWLTDFGVARAVHQQRLTEAGQTIGTVAYMAPEQIRGEAVDARTDIYALGLTLWQMLTGKTPLTGETENETIARRINTAATGTLPGEDSVPPVIRRIVRRCLEPDPKHRYPDAGALVDDLTRGTVQVNRGKNVRRFAWTGLVVGLAGLAAWFLPNLFERDRPSAGPAPVVAILPVTNATGSNEFDWVRNSLAEITAGRLAENRNLMVIESLRVRRTLADLRLTASELDRDRLARFGELLDADRIVRG